MDLVALYGEQPDQVRVLSATLIPLYAQTTFIACVRMSLLTRSGTGFTDLAVFSTNHPANDEYTGRQDDKHGRNEFDLHRTKR